MKVGTLLMNTRTGGIGEVISIREVQTLNWNAEPFTYRMEVLEYRVYGRRTDRDMWIGQDSMNSFIRRGILIEWPDELKPKEYIPRYDFQKG